MPDFLNLQYEMFEGVGQYNIPQIEPTYKVNVDKWIEFNFVKTRMHKDGVGVHFFIYDQQFERCWNFPKRYATALRPFSCVLSPDFSMYTDFPRAACIFNHYRKHWLGAYWQELGLTVIPTIGWIDKESYEWCFDGEPEGSIVAVSNVGCMRSEESRKRFKEGYNEMLIRLQPKEVLFFAQRIDDYKGNVRFIKTEWDKHNQVG